MRKTKIYNTNVILSKIRCIQYLVSICLFVLKILSKNQILTSIKGRNSVANLRKTIIYITNVDLVNDYVYTKFGLNGLLFFKILSKNSILTLSKGRNSVASLRKTKIYNTNVDLVNDNVHTKFGLNLSICSQDIEQKPNSDKGRNSVANARNDLQ